MFSAEVTKVSSSLPFSLRQGPEPALPVPTPFSALPQHSVESAVSKSENQFTWATVRPRDHQTSSPVVPSRLWCLRVRAETEPSPLPGPGVQRLNRAGRPSCGDSVGARDSLPCPPGALVGPGSSLPPIYFTMTSSPHIRVRGVGGNEADCQNPV